MEPRNKKTHVMETARASTQRQSDLEKSHSERAGPASLKRGKKGERKKKSTQKQNGNAAVDLTRRLEAANTTTKEQKRKTTHNNRFRHTAHKRLCDCTKKDHTIAMMS